MAGEIRTLTRPFTQEMGTRDSCLGPSLYIKIRTEDYRRLTWDEVWGAFAAIYPDRWAVQVFPPESELVNEANVYHLFVLDGEPTGLNIRRRYQ